MKKVYLLTNKSRGSKEVKSWLGEESLRQTVKTVGNPAKADFFLVSGGDGTLLHAISVLGKYSKPFFGINRGTSGFLLNQIEGMEELARALANFKQIKSVKLHMLKGEFVSARGGKKIAYAFNDFYVKANRGNERVMGWVRGAKNFPRHVFDGDGLIISTPQGSTAYNYAAGGPILSLGAKQLAIKSICARSPIRAVVPEQAITAEISRGRASAYGDHGLILKAVKKIKISPCSKSVILLFKPGYDFERKRWQV